MTRRVEFKVEGETLVMNERQCAMLLLVASYERMPRGSRQCGSIRVSIPRLCEALGIREITAKKCLWSLRDLGYILIKPRFAPNGSQRENDYRLTRRGRSVAKVVIGS